jgi:ubiquinone/menaquinone biosynthesis C-methylase UbiE
MISTDKTYESYAVRGINQERLNAILEFAGHSILDVGCGSGAYVLELIGKYNIAGVDYQQFPTWDEKPELFSISDASNLVNYVDNSVDTILSFETLEHLENPEKALQEYYRVCRKNLILTVPNCEVTNGMLDSGLIYKTWVDRTHIQFFDLKTIVSLAEEVGFQVIQKTYINEVSLLPLLFEAFDFSDILGKIARKIIRLKSEKAKKYYITCLLVCEKKNP